MVDEETVVDEGAAADEDEVIDDDSVVDEETAVDEEVVVDGDESRVEDVVEDLKRARQCRKLSKHQDSSSALFSFRTNLRRVGSRTQCS